MVALFYTNISKLTDGSLSFHKSWMNNLCSQHFNQNHIKIPKDMIVEDIHKLYFGPI